jgi:hypothetical protein
VELPRSRDRDPVTKRTGAEGSTVIYSCGRYLDEVIAQGGQMLFRKRTVILDSPRIDTLLVITL